MPFEDDPKYADWRTASDRLTAALQHYQSMKGKHGEELARLDYEKTQAEYDKIVDSLDLG